MKKWLLIVLCIIIYSLPLCMVVYISEQEKEKYAEDKKFDFEISSYGEIKSIERKSMQEYYMIDAKITSTDECSLELGEKAKVLCGINDEIKKGQLIATENNYDINAEFDGIITEIDYSEKIIIKYYDLSKLVMETYFPEEKYDIISSKHFEDENGNKIKLLSKSKILEEGKFKAYLSIPKGKKYMYGKQLTDFRLYTGTEYNNVLVVEKNCVFKQDEAYYIRKVDEDGRLIQDCEVNVGYADDKYICISGDEINEGDYCDSGYSALKEDNDINEKN